MVQRKIGGSRKATNAVVIFDFDGTIADSLPAVIAVFEDLTKRRDHFTPRQVEVMRELSMPALMAELQVPRWKIPLLLLKGRRMIRQHMGGIVIHEGVSEVIKLLHAHGVALYILSSNSTDNVRSYLDRHKLSQYFSGVYGGASLLGKAPRLLKLIDKEAIDVTKSWYVGDETRDVSAARSVGLTAASVTWGYNTRAALEAKQPDVLVDTADELVIALEQIWKK
jgi:phosphoglycolate phosphatase